MSHVLLAQAANVGNRAEIPLGLAQSDLEMTTELSRGTQSTVFEGKYQDQHVAVKKAKIGKSADLDSFKLEVAIMIKLRHVSSVVSLIAARLVPPGASLEALYGTWPYVSTQVTNCLCCPKHSQHQCLPCEKTFRL